MGQFAEFLLWTPGRCFLWLKRSSTVILPTQDGLEENFPRVRVQMVELLEDSKICMVTRCYMLAS